MDDSCNSLFSRAKVCLDAADPGDKVMLTGQAVQGWREGELGPESCEAPRPIGTPGRLAHPRLVAPRDLPRRHLKTPVGKAALVHALAHIELNAINLAWDAVYRFRGLPRDYYDDWVQIAGEEAYHFTLLRDRLQELGYDYGDFEAHDGLWEMARKTAHDPLIRMALVPRVLEARGLDVTPGMMARLRAAGDVRTADILVVILRDEVGHVAAGSRWFRYLCQARGLDPDATYRQLIRQYMTGRIKGPLHRDARLEAGFTEQELAYLEGLEEGA